jgi:hypothetical protein
VTAALPANDYHQRTCSLLRGRRRAAPRACSCRAAASACPLATLSQGSANLAAAVTAGCAAWKGSSSGGAPVSSRYHCTKSSKNSSRLSARSEELRKQPSPKSCRRNAPTASPGNRPKVAGLSSAARQPERCRKPARLGKVRPPRRLSWDKCAGARGFLTIRGAVRCLRAPVRQYTLAHCRPKAAAYAPSYRRSSGGNSQTGRPRVPEGLRGVPQQHDILNRNQFPAGI